MIKALELKGPSCLTNAAQDEPIFVLRANDELAPGIVREWAAQYRFTKNGQGMISAEQSKKCREAMSLADAMDNWRRNR